MPGKVLDLSPIGFKKTTKLILQIMGGKSIERLGFSEMNSTRDDWTKIPLVLRTRNSLNRNETFYFKRIEKI